MFPDWKQIKSPFPAAEDASPRQLMICLLIVADVN